MLGGRRCSGNCAAPSARRVSRRLKPDELAARAFLLVWLFWLLPAEAQTLRYLGQQILPHGYTFRGTDVGGLSGLDYDPASRRFVAISDDRSRRQPARFYLLRLDLARFNTGAAPGHAGVELLDMTYLRDEAERLYEPRAVDPEAVRFGLAPDSLWWASEGDARRGIPPAITEVGASGTAWRSLDVPAHVLPGKKRGVRDNLAFESLALDRAAGRLYVGTENALQQDGPEADVGQPSPARILAFELASGKLLAEYVYIVEAVPQAPPLPLMFRTNGLVELLAGEGMLLALERAYVQGVGNSVRIYRLDLEDATDVSGIASLAGATFQPVRKTLLLDLGTLGVRLDNLEGMSWGPRTAAGRPSLVLVADDNFSPLQETQFLAFEMADRAD
jgi:hypothetical protein